LGTVNADNLISLLSWKFGPTAMNQEINRSYTHVLVGLVFNGCFVSLALWLGKGQISFVLFSIVLMYYGRRLGWLLSRAFLYSSPSTFVVFLCVIWGALVAYLIHLLIGWQQPHWILKWIFGFALGAYVSMPNYGLVAESTIPEHAFKRHELISLLPLSIYILSSVGCAYLLRPAINI